MHTSPPPPHLCQVPRLLSDCLTSSLLSTCRYLSPPKFMSLIPTTVCLCLQLCFYSSPFCLCSFPLILTFQLSLLFAAIFPPVSVHILRFNYPFSVFVSSFNFVSINPCVRSLSMGQTLTVSTLSVLANLALSSNSGSGYAQRWSIR